MRPTLVFLLLLSVSLAYSEDVLVQAGGRSIVLHDDYTWEYQIGSGKNSTGFLELHKSARQTQQLEGQTKKYRILFDPSQWDQVKAPSDAAEYGFQNKAKTGYAMLIYDGLELPMDSMEQVIVNNAKNIDPNAAIQSIEQCEVNGTAGELITYTATGSGIPFTLLAFVATGEFGSVQFTFYTTSAAFPGLRDEFVEAIAGLEF